MEKILSSAMAREELNKAIEKRNSISSTLVEKKKLFDENDVEVREQILSDVERLEQEAKEVDKNIEVLEETRNTLEQQEERMSLMGNVSTETVEARKSTVVEKKGNFADTKEYKSALEHAYKTGDVTQLRSLLVTEPVDAQQNPGYMPIPTIMQREIEVAWEEFGNLVERCNVVGVRGILAVPVELEATDAVWHDERSGRVESEDITFGQLLLNPKFIKKVVELTDEVVLLCGDEFLRYIAREMTYRILLLLNRAIVARTDAAGKGVIGIVGNTNAHTQAAELTFNTPNVAMATLRTWDNVCVVLNKATFFSNVLGMTDSTGHPIYQIMLDNTNRPRYYYAGLPVVFTDALKAYDVASANEAYMIVGNFKGYKLNLPYGRQPSLTYDTITRADEDVEVVVGKLPAAGNITKMGFFEVFTKPAASENEGD